MLRDDQTLQVSSLKFEFPDTGEGVTEGKFLEWEVEVGDEVEEDQVVGEAETDKAVVEIPSPADGVVEELKAEPGDRVEVGEVIMILDTEEETDGESDDVGGRKKQKEDGEAGTEKKDTGEEEKEPEDGAEREMKEDSELPLAGDVLALPRVRKLAEEKGVELASIKTGKRITEKEVLEAAESGKAEVETEEEGESDELEKKPGSGKSSDEEEQVLQPDDVMATPSVRKLAREKNVDLGKVEGSGRDGKITREDVIEVGKEQTAESGSDEAGETPDIHGEEERVEMSQVRKTVADQMEEARFTAPHVTHFDTADVEELVDLREEKKDEVEAHLTYLPFIIKAIQLAMKKNPRINSEMDEESDEIILKNHYDFNIAVDTEHGLMIPLVEEVDEKNIVELASEIGKKAQKAREKDLSPEEMRNGTFSITNLGVIGGEEFTPIINYPQVAMLGIGRIQQTAEVVEGEVEPRHTVKLSLSYDHRVIDGADAARFMNEVIKNLENPENMILEL